MWNYVKFLFYDSINIFGGYVYHFALKLMFGIFYPIVNVVLDENASEAKYCRYFYVYKRGKSSASYKEAKN